MRKILRRATAAVFWVNVLTCGASALIAAGEIEEGAKQVGRLLLEADANTTSATASAGASILSNLSLSDIAAWSALGFAVAKWIYDHGRCCCRKNQVAPAALSIDVFKPKTFLKEVRNSGERRLMAEIIHQLKAFDSFLPIGFTLDRKNFYQLGLLYQGEDFKFTIRRYFKGGENPATLDLNSFRKMDLGAKKTIDIHKDEAAVIERGEVFSKGASVIGSQFNGIIVDKVFRELFPYGVINDPLYQSFVSQKFLLSKNQKSISVVFKTKNLASPHHRVILSISSTDQAFSFITAVP